MNWFVNEFNELSLNELYEILRLRSEVFIVEQNCVYQDNDNKDHKSIHLMLRSTDQTNELIAYSRILPPNISYDGYTSIGRVVTALTHRRKGLGHHIMNKSLDELDKRFKNVPIRIGAQLYLKTFYESYGFVGTSEPYLEDGIYHIEMTKG